MRSALLVALLLCACKEKPPASVEEALQRYPTVGAKIETMKKVIVMPLPSVTEDKMTPDGKIVWYNPRPAGGKEASGNALTLSSSTVGNFAREPFGAVKMDTKLNECASIIETKKLPDGTPATGYLASEAFKVCDKIRYVFVVEEGATSLPVLNDATKTFTPGSYQAKVHGYDLEKGTYFGSVNVAATTPSDVTNHRGDAYGSDAVAGMFLSTAFTGIKTAVKKAVPTADLN